MDLAWLFQKDIFMIIQRYECQWENVFVMCWISVVSMSYQTAPLTDYIW